MSAAGRKDRRILFQQGSLVANAMGGEDLVYTDYAQAWASVQFGTASERRGAAGDGAVQTLTFRTLANQALRAITGRDVIIFDGMTWGLNGPAVAVGAQGHELEFTATMREPEL